MRPSRSALAGLVLVYGGSVACTWIRPNAPGNDYVGAAVFVASAVGATAIHRASTGGCWANCQPGNQCDRETGTCIPIPCGGCPSDTKCVKRPAGDRCERQRERYVDVDMDAGAAPGPDPDGGADGPLASE
jgi:hypothetical protein